MIYTFKVQSQEICHISAEEGHFHQAGKNATLTVKFDWLATRSPEQLLFLKALIDYHKLLEYLIHMQPDTIFSILRNDRQVTLKTIFETLYPTSTKMFGCLINLVADNSLPLMINYQYTGYIQRFICDAFHGLCEIQLGEKT